MKTVLAETTRTHPDFFREIVINRASAMPPFIVMAGFAALIIAVIIMFIKILRGRR